MCVCEAGFGWLLGHHKKRDEVCVKIETRVNAALLDGAFGAEHWDW